MAVTDGTFRKSVMTSNWVWVGRYTLVIVIALVLGAAIGELELFKQTTLGTPKLTAAKLVKFLGYGGALLLFWLLARRASDQFHDHGGRTAFLSLIVVPMATLIVITSGYSVVLVVLRSFMNPSLRNIYNWLFVLGITASALWLVVSLFHHSEPLIELFRSSKRARTGVEPVCSKCRSQIASGAKFCPECGSAVS